MKRIYMTLALAVAMTTGANAQSIDLEGVIARPVAGQSMGYGQSLDTSKVLCYAVYHGPDDIFSGEAMYFMTSFSRPADDPGSFFISGVSWNSDITNADSGFAIFQFPNENQIGMGHTGPNTVSSDSIHLLVNWDKWNLEDSIILANPPYQDGENYGFYFRAIDIRDDGGATINTDPNPGNNIDIQRIVWNSNVGVKEFAKRGQIAVSVYPNPATDFVNIEFNAETNTHATATVRDMVGRVVSVKNFGRILAGANKVSLDVSKLPAGSYTIDFGTGEHEAAAKFTKVK